MAAFTSNDRGVRRYAIRKVMRNLDLAAELGATTYVFWGGREGSETDAGKDIRAALDRYREAIEVLGQYVKERNYATALRHRAETERTPGRHSPPHRRQRSGSSRPSTAKR